MSYLTEQQLKQFGVTFDKDDKGYKYHHFVGECVELVPLYPDLGFKGVDDIVRAAHKAGYGRKEK